MKRIRFMLMPIVLCIAVLWACAAMAQVIIDPTIDLVGFFQQIMKLVGDKNWLALVPFLLIGGIAAFRKYLGAKVLNGWFTTDRGGAVLALGGAVLTGVITAAATPGPHTLGAVITFIISYLLGQQLLFSWLNKIIAPSGKDAAQAIAAGANATPPSATPSAAASAINAELKK